MTEFTDEQMMELNNLFQPRMVEEYMVHVPHPIQQVALCVNSREVLFGGSLGGGKLLQLSTKILTANKGWTTHGELEIGDQVYDHDGLPTTVINKSPIVNTGTYKVTMQDGEEILAHEDHLWNVSTNKQRDNYHKTCPIWKANRRANRPSRSKGQEYFDEKFANGRKGTGKGGGVGVSSAVVERNAKLAQEKRDNYVRPSIWDYTSVVTTKELMDLITAEKSRPSIPVGEPIVGDAPWQSNIPPYTLGAWLGDGDSRTGVIYCCADDYMAFSDELIADGWTTTVKWTTKGRKQPFGAITLYMDGLTLKDYLLADGFLQNKHIPEWIVRTSFADRQAFLGGLLDTDGYVDPHRGRIEFSMAREHMVVEAHKLFWSLGIQPTKISHKITTNQDPNFRGDAWLFQVSQCPDYLCRLPRKRDRLLKANKGPQNHKLHRYVNSVVKVDDVPMQCITVDNPRGLYRVGHTQLVTHNSDFALMSALAYVDVPGYACLVLKRTWPDLNSAGSILSRFGDWMVGKNVKKRDGGRAWVFPSGARIDFGYINSPSVMTKFAGSEYTKIIFDEVTLFESEVYEYMMTRNRRPSLPCAICQKPLIRYIADNQIRFRHQKSDKGGKWCETPVPDPRSLANYSPAPDGTTVFDIPLQIISTANPGNVSHLYFRDRFINPKTRIADGVFIPSGLKDNVYVEQEQYMKNLDNLSPVKRAQLLDGDWDIVEEGALFKIGDFQYVDTIPEPKDVRQKVRFWDLAASDGKQSDYTVGALVSQTYDNRLFLEDLKRVKYLPPEVERLMRTTAIQDGVGVKIYCEQEPGSAGKSLISHLTRNILQGFQFKGIRPTGSKSARAGGLVSQVAAHNFYVRKAEWNKDMQDEFSVFPMAKHDDQVDAVAGALNQIVGGVKRSVRMIV